MARGPRSNNGRNSKRVGKPDSVGSVGCEIRSSAVSIQPENLNDIENGGGAHALHVNVADENPHQSNEIVGHNIREENSVNPNENSVNEENVHSTEETVENQNEVEEQFVDGRRVLTLVGNTFLSSDSVARTIRHTFQTRIDPEGSRWKKISREIKNYYYEEFRKAYYWEQGMEASVRKAWNTNASKRYLDMLSEHKANNKKPDFVPQDIWDAWKKYWESDEFKRIAERNADNRKGKNGLGPSNHTRGSISVAEHRGRLAKKFGRPPTYPELFLHTHTKKGDGKSFVDAKSKAVHDRII